MPDGCFLFLVTRGSRADTFVDIPDLIESHYFTPATSAHDTGDVREIPQLSNAPEALRYQAAKAAKNWGVYRTPHPQQLESGEQLKTRTAHLKKGVRSGVQSPNRRKSRTYSAIRKLHILNPLHTILVESSKK